MFFKIETSYRIQKARIGKIFTYHGVINTPIFMIVGTVGTVKGINQKELINEIKAQIILGNAYHLYLRPGMKIMKKAGGLHQFMNWKYPILTDSGGYQVYSLSSNRIINNSGVQFKSHIDGSYHIISPEICMQIQREIGADIIMALDECTSYPSDKVKVSKSIRLTHYWLERCINWLNKNAEIYNYKQFLFPIVQGNIYSDLRKESAEYISSMNCVGNAIGGLSVGEPEEIMYSIVDEVTNILPIEKPRYLMGVGTPWNILECIGLGIDMFDCVLPTRNGRNGMLFTWKGLINLKNQKWKDDFSALDEFGSSYVDSFYSKAYVRHLVMSKELLGKQIVSIHNLCFYIDLVTEARRQIIKKKFYEWKKNIIPELKQKR